jgi:hypothetical protein
MKALSRIAIVVVMGGIGAGAGSIVAARFMSTTVPVIELVQSAAIMGAVVSLAAAFVNSWTSKAWARGMLACLVGFASLSGILFVAFEAFGFASAYSREATLQFLKGAAYMDVQAMRMMNVSNWLPWGIMVGIPGTLSLSLSYHFAQRKASRFSGALVYLFAGALGFSMFFFHWIFGLNSGLAEGNVVGFMAQGWIIGGLFGLSQFAAMTPGISRDRSGTDQTAQ